MDAVLLALVDAGLITREEAQRIDRNLNPEAARQWAEALIIAAWQAGLLAQQSRLLDVVRGGSAVDDAFWVAEIELMAAAILPAYIEVATEAGSIAVVELGAVTVDTWQFIDESVLSWVDGYYMSRNPQFFGSMPNINQTSRERFADAFLRWNTGEISVDQGDGIDALIREITPIFGPDRAENIAVTETTRIFYEARHAAAVATPGVEYKRLLTAADERVCPICGPMHMQTVALNAGYVHPTLGAIGVNPFHPRCRCVSTFLTAASAGVTPEVDQYVYEGELPEPAR